MLRSRIVDRVQLLAEERLHARVVRQERMRPGAGGVDEGASAPLPVAGMDHKEPVVVDHPVDADRSDHRQTVSMLVGGEVCRDGDVGALSVTRRR